MINTNPTEKQKIGQIGENIAVRFLVKHNYEIIDRNYRKKWGEIDIVAIDKNKILHFIEVKTVSHPVSSETYQPEDNVHPWKRKRLARIIQTYLLHKKVSDETEWKIDVIAVFLDIGKNKAKIRVTENIIL